MPTYGDMIDRIEREILRTDLTTEVQDAIKTAIDHYSDTRFWFTEGNNDTGVNTITSSTTYTLSAEWLEIDVITIEVSSNEYPLIPRTVDWFKEVNTNPSTVVGIPTDYAFHADTYWLYPTPNGVYPVRIYGNRRITALDSTGAVTITDTACTNAWFTHGESLIRNRAKALVYAGKLRNPGLAAVYGGENPINGQTQGYEASALLKLQRKSRRKTATGMIQPTDW